MSFVLYFVICFFLNMIISVLISALIPNAYLAEIITSVVISFLYALLITYDRKHFYKDQRFWIAFFGLSIVFLLLDWILFVI